MRAWPSSLRSRLTLSYAVLLAVPLIVFAIICYVVFAGALMRRTDRFVGDALTAFSRELSAERRATTSAEEAIRTTVDEVRFRDLQVAILDSAHRVVATTGVSDDGPNLDRRPSAGAGAQIVNALRAFDAHDTLALSVATSDGAYRVVSRPLTLRGHLFDVTGAYSLRDVEDVLQRIRLLFGAAIPLLILSAAVGGWMLAKRSLAPVGTMALRAADISASNLHERLPVSGGDELVRLARVINDLLDRLESSFAQQRQFMADASHELRTPTAILRTEADVTLSRPHRDETDYRASVEVMQDAARRLTRIVDDLFLLARADAGHLVTRRAPLDLEDLVHDTARSLHHVADARGVRVELGAMIEAPFEGDADLLGRLLLNLLDNAIKHSPDGGVVDVQMALRAGRYEISVIDVGAGIPREAQAHVFERFFRVDAERSRAETSTTSGAGLGLAIARRIAELHGGQLSLAESRPGRTAFRVSLPAAVGYAVSPPGALG